MGPSVGFVFDLHLTCPPFPNPLQANILITDGDPPKACLADLRFTPAAPDPPTPMAPVQDCGEMVFMAPELLAPSKYGLVSDVPTKEADIYAFGMLILQVQKFDRHHPPLSLTSHRF